MLNLDRQRGRMGLLSPFSSTACRPAMARSRPTARSWSTRRRALKGRASARLSRASSRVAPARSSPASLRMPGRLRRENDSRASWVSPRQSVGRDDRGEGRFEAVPPTLFHYTAVTHLDPILGSAKLINRLVSEVGHGGGAGLELRGPSWTDTEWHTMRPQLPRETGGMWLAYRGAHAKQLPR